MKYQVILKIKLIFFIVFFALEMFGINYSDTCSLKLPIYDVKIEYQDVHIIDVNVLCSDYIKIQSFLNKGKIILRLELLDSKNMIYRIKDFGSKKVLDFDTDKALDFLRDVRIWIKFDFTNINSLDEEILRNNDFVIPIICG